MWILCIFPLQELELVTFIHASSIEMANKLPVIFLGYSPTASKL